MNLDKKILQSLILEVLGEQEEKDAASSDVKGGTMSGGAFVASGTEARKELESFFHAKVYLALHVKVRSDWRENDRVLNDLGMLGSGE